MFHDQEILQRGIEAPITWFVDFRVRMTPFPDLPLIKSYLRQSTQFLHTLINYCSSAERQGFPMLVTTELY